VQDADDFDEPWFDRAVEDDMDGFGDWRLAAFVAGAPDVQAAQSGREFAAVQAGNAQRAGRHPPHRRRQQAAIADARLDAMPGLARAQDAGEVDLSRIGQPIARQGSARGQIVEPDVEVGVLNFRESAAIERREPRLDMGPQRL